MPDDKPKPRLTSYDPLHGQQAPAQGGLSAGAIFGAVLGAILVAAAVIFTIYMLASANDDLECETRNAERVMDGRPAIDCDLQ